METTGWEAVIGLEVHLELSLPEKMFCATPAAFGAEPNTHVCPETLGLPGSLPVVNEDAVKATVRAGLALGCTIAGRTKFDRKHYTYPDLPKGYQISQYDLPLCRNGVIRMPREDGSAIEVRVRRVHLEEDTGKLIHEEGSDHSLVDLNRAGVPLVEIVTEPDLRSTLDTVEVLKELKSILEYLDISDCNMEEGSLRCEPNVSVRRKGETALGTKTEIKNLNSFRSVQGAVDHEIRRHIQMLERGETVVQQTMLWNEALLITEPMRSKEGEQDYRYFPDPDIPPLELAPELIEEIREGLPVFPRERRRSLVERGVPDYNAEIITRSRAYADLFDGCLSTYDEPQKVSNLLIGPLLEEMNQRSLTPETLTLLPAHAATYVRMLEEGKVGQASRKKLLQAMLDTGKAPGKLVDELGLTAVSDRGAIESLVDEVLSENAAVVEQIKGGKTTALMSLVGKTMQKSKGRADARLVQEILRSKLGVE